MRRELDVDWEQVSRDAWPPLLVGTEFFLVPTWSRAVTPPGRLRLEITPGMACGTGHHPATQLCLQAMERCVHRRSTVLDVGTGSGILSVAASLLGAQRVVACDIDPDAVTLAHQRLQGPIFIGSADCVRPEFADVVVANISAAAIDELAHELERVRKTGGKLILSGFPEWDVPEAFTPSEILKQGEWDCWIC